MPDKDRSSAAFRRRADQLDRKVAANVKRVGWHFTGVFPDADDEVPVFWGYTTGLLRTHQHPELVMFGVAPETMHAIIAGIVKRIEQGQKFSDGERVPGLVQGDFELFFRSVASDDPEYPCSVSQRFLGQDDFPVLQVVLPDTQNRFPWEDHCEDKIIKTQQLLFRERVP